MWICFERRLDKTFWREKKQKDFHWKRYNNNNTWSIFLILASLNNVWAIFQISSIISKLHVDDDCDANNAIIAKIEKDLMIDWIKNKKLFLWEFEFSIDESYRL